MKKSLSSVIVILFTTLISFGQTEQEILFTLDQCLADVTGTNQDYSEFASLETSCTGISVVGNNLFRRNPDINAHSCTPGVNGTPAMCVDADPTCEFIRNSERAVRFDIRVPANGSLSSLEFYQKSPRFFNWINGRSGVNNSPQNFAVRVLVGDQPVFSQTDIRTTVNYTLVSFDFSSITDFSVTESTIFSFELTPYCQINAGGEISVWDLDEIRVVGDVGTNSSISGGTLTGGPFDFCVGDMLPDNIPADGITLSGNSGTNSQFIITDELGNILELPSTFSAVDFDNQGAGVCLVWHLSFEDGLMGAQVGLNANDLQGCFSLSNPITVNKTTAGAVCDAICMAEGGTLTGGPFSFCVGDMIPDTIATDGITLSGNTGTNSQFVITDELGNIIGLPPSFSAVDFDDQGPGVCLVWHLSFEDGLMGAQIGLNANDLQGCFSLSNPIMVNRTQPDGGQLVGGPFTFCVGDMVADTIPANGISLSGNMGTNSQFIVTDDQNNILELPTTFSAINFDDQGPGITLIWHLSFEDGLMGAQVGLNANDLQGCFSLSNPITVNRTQPDGGQLIGGPFTFCVGDMVADTIPANGISLSGNMGTNSQFIVTDSIGNILGLPQTFSAFDFEGQAPGVCLVWHLSFEDGLVGAQIGLNANDLQGCFSLSNSLTVNKLIDGEVCQAPCDADGGTLTGGPFSFDMIGDGIPDTIPAGSISLTGTVGDTTIWIVTDDQNNILGLPPMPSAVDFDTQGDGVCLIWNLSVRGEVTGLAVGMSADSLIGCTSLSNPITVNRSSTGICTADGGTLDGGPFTFCVGDMIADTIAADAITLTGNVGTNSQFVITDTTGIILDLPATFSAVDFDDQGAGVSLVWHLSFEDGLMGAQVGLNANDLEGCFDLSNPLMVTRIQTEGGTLTGGPFTFCVGDMVADTISTDGISLSGNIGTNSQFVVTDSIGGILALPSTFSAFDFDAQGEGICLVWHLSFEDGLMGAQVGLNANDLDGCFSLSNPITVNKVTDGEVCQTLCDADGGILTGGPFTFNMVSDGIQDTIAAGSITLTGTVGDSTIWVITDDSNNIISLPTMPSNFDFDTLEAGVCQIWNLSIVGNVSGIEVGMNVSDFDGCFDLSNAISVVRNLSCEVEGGILQGGPFDFCVGDTIPDNILNSDVTLSGGIGSNQFFVATDTLGNILEFRGRVSRFDFNDFGPGFCFIQNLSFEDGLLGLEINLNIDDLQGCFSLSNAITINKADEGAVCTMPIDTMTMMMDTMMMDTMMMDTMMMDTMMMDTMMMDTMMMDTMMMDTMMMDTMMMDTMMMDTMMMDTMMMDTMMMDTMMMDTMMMDTMMMDTMMMDTMMMDTMMMDTMMMDTMMMDTMMMDTMMMDTMMIDTMIMDTMMMDSMMMVCTVLGGVIEGGPFVFDMVGDGFSDMVPIDSITLSQILGDSTQWIVTDDANNIIGLPDLPSDFEFDDQGEGTCFFWNLSFQGVVEGLAIGTNTDDLVGCFALSNSISVVRTAGVICDVNGGTLVGGPFVFDIVNDGIPDTIANNLISLTQAMGDTIQWIITDDQGTILALPPVPSNVNFEQLGTGTAFISSVSYSNILGLELFANVEDLVGCFNISNEIAIERNIPGPCQVNGGSILGGPFTIDTVSDSLSDFLDPGSIILANAQGANIEWIVTDAQGFILGLPAIPSAFDFDSTGPGTSLIWNVSFDNITGLEIGGNVNSFTGCFELSNSINVMRTSQGDCQANGGDLIGGPFTFDTVGDTIPNMIASAALLLANAQGDSSQWLVTDSLGVILGLPNTPDQFDFNGLGLGTCFFWHLSFDTGLTGLAVDANVSDLEGCFDLSDSVAVIRTSSALCMAAGGELTGGPFDFCVGDMFADNIPDDMIALTGNVGSQSQLLVTDDQGTILSLPQTISGVDFNGITPGNCLVWNISFEDSFSGAALGDNINDFEGCFGLSNSIEVNKVNDGEVCAQAGSENAIIAINEIIPDGNLIEFINLGSTAFDISSYWICESGQYEQIDDLVVNCGSLNLMPGAMVTVEGVQVNIASDDGEMGLFSDNDFNDPSNVVDYVEWGSTGHNRSDEAVTAGQWTTGDFVAAFAMDESLEYDGGGNAPSDWNTALANPCGMTELPTDPAIIVISEIIAEGNFVELRNIGGNSANISTLWLCNNMQYDQISTLNNICGDFDLDPGEIVTVEVSNISIASADGEMALYLDMNFGSSASILDYVEWGSTNHDRSNIAVAANIWTSGDFVTGFATDESLEFDGNGDTSADWNSATPNPCDEVMFVPPTVGSLVSMEIFGNPVADMLKVNLQTVTSFNVLTLDIRDLTGVLVKSESINQPSSNSTIEIDVSDMPQGLYYITVRELFGTVSTKMVKH